MGKLNKSTSIAQILKEEIARQRLPTGTPVSTERQIAKRFSVANVTAKRALDILADEKVLFRRQRSGTYVNIPPAPIPRIGIVAELEHRYVANRDKTINFSQSSCFEILGKENCITTHISYQELLTNKNIEKKLSTCDGLLIGAEVVDSRTLPTLRAFNGPKVAFDNDYIREDLSCSEVLPDFTNGFRDFFKQYPPSQFTGIIALDPGHPNGRARLESASEVLAEYGQKISEYIDIPLMCGDSGQLSSYRFICPILPRCRGKLIISPSDFLSFGIVEAMRDHGVEPGKDVSILSMDNVEALGICPYEKPLLTSIDMEKKRVAEESVQLLLYILKRKTDCRYRVVIPSHVAFRDSITHNHC